MDGSGREKAYAIGKAKHSDTSDRIEARTTGPGRQSKSAEVKSEFTAIESIPIRSKKKIVI